VKLDMKLPWWVTAIVAVVIGGILLICWLQPAEVDRIVEYVPEPYEVQVQVPGPVRVMAEAYQDEQIGAFRVDLPEPMYCFPIRGAGFDR